MKSRESTSYKSCWSIQIYSVQNKGNWLFTTDFCFLKIPFDRVLRNYIEVPDSLMVPSDSPNGFLATQE